MNPTTDLFYSPNGGYIDGIHADIAAAVDLACKMPVLDPCDAQLRAAGQRHFGPIRLRRRAEVRAILIRLGII